MSAYPLLETIDDPAALRQLERKQLPQLAQELREFLIESVSKTGGHLSSNLGTVELAIALHYVFNTPEDRIVWDVGHQTYAHKVLTGRRAGMAKLRMLGGVSGFPRRDESPYDTFGTGHSSTSISAALGMAIGARDRGEQKHVVAVIGDGAMTAGMAFEALNNAGVADANLLVILNDNDMSISPPVGALNKYLARLFSGHAFNAARRAGEKVLGVSPSLLEFAKRTEEHLKGMLTPGTLFEEFGFNYIGPIDGHDLDSLVPTLKNIAELKGPQFLHVITRKGHGYKLAEADPVLYHGVSKFDSESGIQQGKGAGRLTYTQIFGDWLCDMAAEDDRLVAITPAMKEGSGMVRFAEEFPRRFHDVGIAEQHALTFAAGLACEGIKPVVAIYSTFLQRAYDQLIHDIALQRLPVMLAIDRGGLVGADGATHNGAFDLSYLACVPNLVVMAPADENECRQMLTTAFLHDGPSAVRYPRGHGPGVALQAGLASLPIGKGEIRRSGARVALLAFGSMLAPALEAGERLDATVANMRFVKPLDHELVRELAFAHDLLVTVEENVVIGGAGAEVARSLEEQGLNTRMLRLGLPDRFTEHGDAATLLAQLGLDAEHIAERVKRAILE
ncbi:MAG: 1-deoxy-D-xylulose-5-phosphate synthase [Burkholderiales bacterium]|jgi:1-deoxy-D-xylulose-5-phosphate synthase|uniref:1-deoxy-D-xylulose-5-phosphate synthase n=1 Tax=Candidatus Desulfobacillus denitrificans TaxID=2608985 RepID=A0A809RZG4_9PROT|nr:1-deoxy-D-xylulose-5-phosphate synthase [Burkholderiales bacterium]MEB2315932.1 1-deoxy-D-xylulose-5-phosphate synthase [Xanthomonadaceae bacterium]OQY75161.1 MAG: 1-deoxy-D-xylulose-5-phosphate synthase [Rhodocyclaceae bacterium UTPRO2]BBO21576.1 1-deoxy-D-xylulose-5-phosphate synthase [Candidatus Desulfobacillus denitrificans]GIK46411.1 MAG: 1-deoxy-D-xylulose-5-phosphate synthase [Betaproteobacteria bacterium]GJQ55946.1 MAG: 1-deoxy-D-xylulose-5-phosphate synthase [Rhodocyclaceae bacteri